MLAYKNQQKSQNVILLISVLTFRVCDDLCLHCMCYHLVCVCRGWGWTSAQWSQWTSTWGTKITRKGLTTRFINCAILHAASPSITALKTSTTRSYLAYYYYYYYYYSLARWLTRRASDYRIADARFDSRPGRCCVKTLGKFLTPMRNVVLYNII